MEQKTRLWLIRTDRCDPWWHCICCFYTNDENIAKDLFEVEKKMHEEQLFLEEITEDKLYSLDQQDVDWLATSGIIKEVGLKVFKDGELDLHEIVTADWIEEYLEKRKKHLNSKSN